MNTTLFLVALSGICWTVVYVDAIRIGFRNKTYAIPFWALALNFAWELLCTIIGYQEIGINDQMIANIVWLFCDVFILITYFKYGKLYYPIVVQKYFYLNGIVILFISFVVQYAFIREFGLIMGSSYSAFLQNLLMSILFIGWALDNNRISSQSILIGISKCIGTLAPTILFGMIGSQRLGGANTFLLYIGLIIFALDIVYITCILLIKRNTKSRTIETY